MLEGQEMKSKYNSMSNLNSYFDCLHLSRSPNTTNLRKLFHRSDIRWVGADLIVGQIQLNQGHVFVQARQQVR